MQLIVSSKDGHRFSIQYVDATLPDSPEARVEMWKFVRQFVNDRNQDWKFIDIHLNNKNYLHQVTIVNDDYNSVIVISRYNAALFIYEYENDGAKLIKSIIVQ